MKKIFVICVMAAALYACGGSNNQPVKTDSVASALKPDLSDNPVYKKGLALIGGSDCLTCHKIDDKLTGPAYRDVANKYNGDDTTVNRLAAKIITGGSGVWGTIPMTPHPTLSLDDAKAMVQYIMLLKKS